MSIERGALSEGEMESNCFPTFRLSLTAIALAKDV